MLVFAREKLVFLSMPKTGTTAWQAALGARASLVVRDPPELKHAPVFRYNRFLRPMLERFLGEGLTVLAVMREPVDWLGSWYRYRQRPALDATALSTKGRGFDDFVLAWMQGARPAFADVGSQARFLAPQKNGTAVTHLFRYEDQTGLRAFLEARLEMEIVTARHNASPGSPPALSADAAARLRRKCAPEFALYAGIGAGGAWRPLPAPG